LLRNPVKVCKSVSLTVEASVIVTVAFIRATLLPKASAEAIEAASEIVTSVA
jgi:hypothetical protein